MTYDCNQGIQRDQALTGDCRSGSTFTRYVFFCFTFERNHFIHAVLLAVPGYSYTGKTYKPMEKRISSGCTESRSGLRGRAGAQPLLWLTFRP